jgi:hypothetical protein
VSFVFDIEGETVWSPALRVGEAFARCAEALGAAFDAEPGFAFNGEDMIEINRGQFGAFVERLAAISGDQPPYRVRDDLVNAIMIPSLVMLGRANALPPIDARAASLVREVGATMPR